MNLLLHPSGERAVILHGHVFGIVGKLIDVAYALGVVLVSDLNLNECVLAL